MPDSAHICVFCGSSSGSRPAYAVAARRVGDAIACQGLGLVYGGGSVGLMGELADAALRSGGRVVGVIPDALAAKEVAHYGLTELHVVPGMHERKALMAARASAFLVLPGGVGTFEEFFEILTWAVLGLHAKPIGLLDVEGYFGPLIGFLDHAVREGFVRPEHMRFLRISSDPEQLVAELARGRRPDPARPWIGPAET
jgi:uncharacterized protein (TIGR00730 family)